jgi:hypothetical protein
LNDLAIDAKGKQVYTVIVSPGYFAEKGDWPLVAMFAVLLSLAVVSITRLGTELRRSPASQTGSVEHPDAPATSQRTWTGERP